MRQNIMWIQILLISMCILVSEYSVKAFLCLDKFLDRSRYVYEFKNNNFFLKTKLSTTDSTTTEKYDVILSSGFLAFGRHIGFLKAIEESVYADSIKNVVGTSSGAFIGSLWAAGYSATQIFELISSKKPYQFLQPSLAFWNGFLSFRPMINYLEQNIHGLPKDIQDLKLKTYLGVSTLDKQHTLLSKGALAKAMAASCAVPVLFAPVEVEGKNYQDGGVIDRTGAAAWSVLPNRSPKAITHLIEGKLSKVTAKNVPTFSDASYLNDIYFIRSAPSSANLLKFANLEQEIQESYASACSELKLLTISNPVAK